MYTRDLKCPCSKQKVNEYTVFARHSRSFNFYRIRQISLNRKTIHRDGHLSWMYSELCMCQFDIQSIPQTIIGKH